VDGTGKSSACSKTQGLLVGANLYDFENTQVVHHLKPGAARERDLQARRDYIVKERQGHHHRRVYRPDDGRPALVGRSAPGGGGRRKGVKIEPENQTLASITFQNYFRLYPSCPA
jgi:preprotein translocase subunit SecA